MDAWIKHTDGKIEQVSIEPVDEFEFFTNVPEGILLNPNGYKIYQGSVTEKT